MNSLIAISLWIALVTVIPGLVTIATLFGAFAFVDPEYASTLNVTTTEWIWGAVAVVMMVLTQAVGILLEGVLVDRRWLGDTDLTMRDGLLDADQFPIETIHPYEEYERLYLLLVRMHEGDDPYGHLERAVAQFFMTNNTLVSFGAGIVATAGILAVSITTQGVASDVLVRGVLYLGGLLTALSVSYYVAIARFQVMTLSIWSLRTRPSSG